MYIHPYLCVYTLRWPRSLCRQCTALYLGWPWNPIRFCGIHDDRMEYLTRGVDLFVDMLTAEKWPPTNGFGWWWWCTGEVQEVDCYYIVGSFNMHIVRTWKWTFARGQYVAISDRTIQYVSAWWRNSPGRSLPNEPTELWHRSLGPGLHL